MKTIQTLLIANRAEISRRIIRTCKKLGIRSVAVFSQADARLPFVREADTAVCIGPAPAAESYLNVPTILAAAQKTGADAIHPGYGFLSENATFAAAVSEAGLIWVGPSPIAIEQLGDKRAARKLAQKHGVPTLSGFDDDNGNDNDLIVAATKMGFPILIKAAAGGGGRGMRHVETPGQLTEAIASARREALAGFGNDKLLLERYVQRPRHIEVQILADHHGHVVHLFERECSIQRRHQKIVEEAPSPAVDSNLRQKLGNAAVQLARAANYTNAGTAEFLLDDKGNFYFLEMNTRLQVEHPVTELITGVDLVEQQLRIAEGNPLPWSQQEELSFSGHAIEARLNAEDPMRNDLPSTGVLAHVDLNSEGLRVDAGYESANEVTMYYDPMLAKLIVWGASRPEATRKMARALRAAWVPSLATNLPLLRQIFDHPSWKEGDLHTAFLPQHQLPQPPPINLTRGALAAAVYSAAQRRDHATYSPAVAPNWRIEGSAPTIDTWESFQKHIQVATHVLSPTDFRIVLSEQDQQSSEHRVCVLHRSAGNVLCVRVDEVVETWRFVHRGENGTNARQPTVEDGDVVYIHLGDSEAMLSLKPRFGRVKSAANDQGSCIAPNPGKVVKVHVSVGDVVQSGDALMTLEAMKMEQIISAPHEGKIGEVLVEVGQVVTAGTLLVHLTPLPE